MFLSLVDVFRRGLTPMRWRANYLCFVVLSSNPATRQPGNPATRQPGNPANLEALVTAGLKKNDDFGASRLAKTTLQRARSIKMRRFSFEFFAFYTPRSLLAGPGARISILNVRRFGHFSAVGAPGPIFDSWGAQRNVHFQY